MAIKATPAEMRKIGTRFENEAKNLSTSVNTINSLIKNQLPLIWEGKSERAYTRRWNDELKPALNNAVSLMDELKKNINTYADNIESVDNKGASDLK